MGRNEELDGLGVENHLTGYYAVSAIDPDGKLHIFRDSIAPLYAAHIISIDSLIFATRESHISELCKVMKWTHTVAEKVSNDTYLIFDNGQLIHQATINPRGNTAYESKYAGLSLGYQLDTGADSTADADADLLAQVYEPGAEYRAEDGTVLDESEYMFLEEMRLYADSSYTIKNYRNHGITVSDFHALDLDEKLCCTVIRSDGTICSPVNYYDERIFDGVG